MRVLCHLALVSWLALAGSSVHAQPTASAPPPAEWFHKRPDISAVRMSASGRYLALAQPGASGRTGLVVIDLEGAQAPRMVVNYADADVDEFQWVGDDWLVYDLTDLKDGGGHKSIWPGLFRVDRQGGQLTELVSGQGKHWTASGSPGDRRLSSNHTLLTVPRGSTREVIVGEWRFNADRDLEIIIPKRLDIVTGLTRPVVTDAPPGAREWYFSPQGEPRAVLTRRKAQVRVLWRKPEGGWRELVASDAYELPWVPRLVDARDRLYVEATSASGEVSLHQFDFDQGKPQPEPLVRTPGFDFTGRLLTDADSGRALGVRVDVDAETTVWFEPAMKALQQEAERRLPGRVVNIGCRRCGEPDMRALVHAYSDRDPGQYWVYVAEGKRWLKVGDRRRGVDLARMGSTDFERVPTRDGQRMPLWITRPAGAKAPGPAVVLVHGGPWLRGRYWQWDADVQFLATRGYTVIEPEFRGSRGYGVDWFRAGWREWGRAMQDDVADAVAWAVKQGLADPQRVCIAGASYGGYATLMGLIRHPELYRCGVAWAAVTDPRLMFQWRAESDQGSEVRAVDYPRMIGDPEADAKRLDEVTPVLLASRIQAPLLLAHGADDRRVPLVHGQRMRRALQDAGRPPLWVEYGDEGHGWYAEANRVDFARRLEAFLAQHIGSPR